jgi:hypothetical protein
MSGEQLDDPNRQAVGLDPAWVEGTGGEEGEPPAVEPQAAAGGTGVDAMTKAELLAYAQSLGVTPANNDMTKDEIRAGVDAKLAEG